MSKIRNIVTGVGTAKCEVPRNYWHRWEKKVTRGYLGFLRADGRDIVTVKCEAVFTPMPSLER